MSSWSSPSSFRQSQQQLKVVIYSGSCRGQELDSQDAYHRQRSSLCGILAALSLVQARFEVVLVDCQTPVPLTSTIPCTPSLGRLLEHLDLSHDAGAEGATIDLENLRKTAFDLGRRRASLFTPIASEGAVIFDTASPSSAPGLLLANGQRVKGDVLLCCDPAPSILASCTSLSSDPPTQGTCPVLQLNNEVPWSTTHRAIFGPATFSFRCDSVARRLPEERDRTRFEALVVAQFLIEAQCLTFVLSQASIPQAVGVALRVFSDFKREHLSALAGQLKLKRQVGQEGEGSAATTTMPSAIEDYIQRCWLLELQEDWSRRYLSNI